MPTKSPIRRAKPALRLPSLTAFDKLTLRQRTQLFAKWCATKRGAYDYWSIRECPLAQFGQAITRDQSTRGGAWQFLHEDCWYDVTSRYDAIVSCDPSTFAALTKHLNTHLGETA